jgi:hypothetical protein
VPEVANVCLRCDLSVFKVPEVRSRAMRCTRNVFYVTEVYWRCGLSNNEVVEVC